MTLNISDKNWRKKIIRYWLKDPFWGGLDYLGHYLLRYIPIVLNAGIGAFLGELAGKYRFKARSKRVKHNLSLLRPDLSQPARDLILTRMWRHIGQSMSEYSLLDKLHAKSRVNLLQGDYLQPFIANKQAVIFVSAHTGNWEVSANYVTEYGFDVLGLYQPLRNRFTRKIADIARKRIGVLSDDSGSNAKRKITGAAREYMGEGTTKLIETSPNAMRLVCKHLANKGALWIGIDEVKNAQVQSPTLGRQLSLRDSNAAYAVRLAQRYDAAIIPVWSKRNAGSNFTVNIGKPLTVAQGDAARIETLVKLDQLLETWIMDNLEQWHMLHELRL